MPHLRRYFYIARLFLALSLSLLLALWVALLYPFRLASLSHRQQLTRLGLGCMAAALPLRIQVYGTPPKQPALWISNHISWTDIMVLGRFAPLSFLSKAEVLDWPVAGWLAKQAGTLFIRRGNAAEDDIQGQLKEYLAQKRALVIFPEGTTTDGHKTGLFHSRLLSCAIETETPIQPIALRYRRNGQYDPIAPFIGDDELPQHLNRLLAHPAAEVEVHFLPLLSTQGASRTQLAKQARQAIDAVVAEEYAPKESDVTASTLAS